MMAEIPNTLRPRIGQFVRLLASDQPGEVVAAAAALKRTLAGVGADLNDLGDALEKPPAPVVIYRDRPAHDATPAWAKAAAASRQAQTVSMLISAIEAKVLTKWERDFAQSIIDQIKAKPWTTLSEKQQIIVDRLITKWQEDAVSS